MKLLKKLFPYFLIPVALVALNPFVGNVTVTGGRLSFGTGGIFAPPQGTSAPGTCTTGDVFFDTDATAGQNVLGCTATDTWTLQGGSTPEVTIVTDSSTAVNDTGTSLETHADITIAANTFAAGDKTRLYVYWQKTGTAGTWAPQVVAGPDLGSASTWQAGTSTTAAILGVYMEIEVFWTGSSAQRIIAFRSTDTSFANMPAQSTTTLDATVDQHIYLRNTCANSGDTCTLLGYSLIRRRNQ